jgi:hypothetical protein
VGWCSIWSCEQTRRSFVIHIDLKTREEFLHGIALWLRLRRSRPRHDEITMQDVDDFIIAPLLLVKFSGPIRQRR